MKVSGISSPFGELSRSSGQVSHVLLTRSPLGLHHSCEWMDLVRLACVKHAASVRPEPGSNSPSRSRNDRQSVTTSGRRLDQLVSRLRPDWPPPAGTCSSVRGLGLDQISNSKMTGANDFIATASTEVEADARTRTSFLSSVFKELRGSRKEVIPPVLPERAS